MRKMSMLLNIRSSLTTGINVSRSLARAEFELWGVRISGNTSTAESPWDDTFPGVDIFLLCPDQMILPSGDSVTGFFGVRFDLLTAVRNGIVLYFYLRTHVK